MHFGDVPSSFERNMKFVAALVDEMRVNESKIVLYVDSNRIGAIPLNGGNLAKLFSRYGNWKVLRNEGGDLHLQITS